MNRNQETTLVYNHALLSLWHEDAVVAIADLDEYLVTSRRTTLAQLLHSGCTGGGLSDPGPVAVSISRRVAYCTGCLRLVGAPGGGGNGSSSALLPDESSMLRAHSVERTLWLNASTALFVNPHDVYPLPGLPWPEKLAPECAHWLHIKSQVAFRPPATDAADLAPVGEAFLWALADATQAAPTLLA
ncbi:hypothetical protein TSOC_009745 [Tetrabaena socialis]|uniref:Glycosyltransferase family 92 protein n=1 Tax=Tetrabaena socialis TaxID=47790 RepID=A0A2J7ZV24_9CHLO|nr:hypothetical protein TSOC_009745 [Tetrabaena socialis]|eukprot:PNH04124.1 hypothetical protein TSOC_009745 [Tetrabaena socialis]